MYNTMTNIQESSTSTGWNVSEGEWLLGNLHAAYHSRQQAFLSLESTMHGMKDIEEEELVSILQNILEEIII